MRQRENVEPKYELIYDTIEGVVEGFIKAFPGRPQDVYTRLKLAVPAAWVTAIWMRQISGQASVDAQRQHADAFLNEPAGWWEAGVDKAGTRTDYLRATDAFFAKTIGHRLAGCDLILDLGCGWGHRMVDVHLTGVDAKFIGGDRSAHSARIVASLAGLFPAAQLDWFPFNFLDPDFSPLPGGFKNIGVFTCHAIEQVEVLGSALFDRLFQRFPGAAIKGVHVEPVVWQIDPTRAAEAEYARRHDYNTDLLQVVKNHPALKVTEVVSVIHDGHDLNPSSLIAWERVL